jgi:hypothetical protein
MVIWQELLGKMARFFLIMTGLSVGTTFLLLISVPGLDKPATVAASVVTSLLVALYDFGIFSPDLEI